MRKQGKIEKDQVWVQAALDMEDIELAKRVAFLALDNGAEWLEVGTPLLYRYGFSAIGIIRQAVGQNAVLVADYKCPIARLCASQAAQEGADYVLLAAIYNEDIQRDNIEFCRESGIEPIIHLSVNPKDIAEMARNLEAIGVKYLFAHRYAAKRDSAKQKNQIDVLRILKESCSCHIGITSDDLKEAEDTVLEGADWITFGRVLRQYDSEAAKKWINRIHSAR